MTYETRATYCPGIRALLIVE